MFTSSSDESPYMPLFNGSHQIKSVGIYYKLLKNLLDLPKLVTTTSFFALVADTYNNARS